MWIKRLRKLVYGPMTILMLALALFGVYGFFTAPARAARAQSAIEEDLRKKAEQIEANKEAMLAEREARKNEQNQQEVPADPTALWNRYSDASQVDILGIGDSVMVSAINEFYAAFPNGYFDAVFGRTIYDGIAALRYYADSGQLGDVMVIGLATNVPVIYDEDIRAIIDLCQGRPVFFLNAYGVSNNANEVINRVLPEYKNAYLVDWASYFLQNRHLIQSDGLHPNHDGSVILCNIIAGRINETVLVQPPYLDHGEKRVPEVK